ncbi:Uncharacterised protein [Myroides odoratus]|uniref:Uncharacterized protein n=1 Tax=Myroides odoratus TaxID=256 RepID=A0A378RLA4_MYROD|nr:Uncharacterised protein [Myroides odoratus]
MENNNLKIAVAILTGVVTVITAVIDSNSNINSNSTK